MAIEEINLSEEQESVSTEVYSQRGDYDKNWFSHSDLSQLRAECVRKYGPILQLEYLVSGLTEAFSRHPITVGNILDFGAGEGDWKGFLQHMASPNKAFALEPDLEMEADFRALQDIPDNQYFSLIIANQVFEHIPLQDCLGLTMRLADKLQPDGQLFLTIPNTAHPTRYLSNEDHINNLSATTLYYLCRKAGLEVLGLYRYSKKAPQGWMERLIVKYITRIYRMDWADSVAIMARKAIK